MVFKSPFDDIKPPEQFKDSLSEYFWHQLDVYRENTLLVDYATGRQWTGAQIKTEATKIARYLVEVIGLRAGDSCVFFYPHSDHIILVALGVLFAGGSVCAGARDDPASEHRYMMESMSPVVVFADCSLYKELTEMRNANGENNKLNLHFKLCILNDQFCQQQGQHLNGTTTFGLHQHLLSYSNKLETNGASESNGKTNTNLLLPVQVNPDDAAFVLLTSGSTGKPKPVARSHRNSIYVCYSFINSSLWHMDEHSVLAGHLQLDHGTGTFSLKMTLAKGLKMIIMDGYDFNIMSTAIERHKITDCILGSALLHNFISTPESVLAKYDLISLRNLLAVGSPIASHSATREFMDRYPKLSIRQAYGMTECGFMSVVSREASKEDSRTVGWLLPNLTVKLIDRETGIEVTEFEREGELFVAGPTVSPGYLGARYAEQTSATFLPDGFYRSHDISSVTPDGRLVIKGRYGEVLCLHDGWKVLPYELESVLLTHPAVLEACVIGIPHPDLPTCHAPRAYIVLKEAWRNKVSERELCEFAASHLSEPKQLSGGIKLMEELPRISVGKVDKKLLRKLDGY